MQTEPMHKRAAQPLDIGFDQCVQNYVRELLN